MENFVNNEKFKTQLEHELDKIIDQKRFVYDQIQKLEVKIYFKQKSNSIKERRINFEL